MVGERGLACWITVHVGLWGSSNTSTWLASWTWTFFSTSSPNQHRARRQYKSVLLSQLSLLLWRGIIQARLKQRGVDIISSAICVPIEGGCDEWCWCLVGQGGSEDGGGRPVTAPCPHPSEKGNVERLPWLRSFPPAPSPKYLYKQSCFLSLPKMPGALVSWSCGRHQ